MESEDFAGEEASGGAPIPVKQSFDLNQFLPMLLQLQRTQDYLTAAPTFIPQTFQDQIQFVFTGSAYYLYIYFNNQWNNIPLGGSEPSGTIKAFGGSSAPTGYLICDGSAVSRTTYAALFAAIGTTFGAGNGTTTFNIPDARGKVLAGYKSGDANFGTLGHSLGEATHLLTTAEMPSHSHNVPIGITGSFANSPGWNGDATHSGTNPWSSDPTGGGGAHNNIQPSLTINYIIKT